MATDPRFPVRKINLVEQEEWKPFDPSDKIAEWASDAAWQDFSHMSADSLWEYVNDLATWRTKGKKAPRKFSSEQIQWIAEQFRGRRELVEETRNAIIDAMTWMYEAAYLPEKGDIEEAMERAVGVLIYDYPLSHDLWEPVLQLEESRRGPKEWRPRKRLEEREILQDLLKHISFEQEEGHYDRYLVFDFRSSQVVKDLLSRSDWDEPTLTKVLKQEFKDLSDTYLWRFFDALKKIMEDVDISNRTDWKLSWRAMLGSGVVPSVQKEMAEAVKYMPEVEDA